MKRPIILSVLFALCIAQYQSFSQTLGDSFKMKMLKINPTIIFDSVRFDANTFATTYIPVKINDTVPHITWGILDSSAVVGISQQLFSKCEQVHCIYLLVYHKSTDRLIVFQNRSPDGIFQRISFILMESIRIPSHIFVFDSTLSISARYVFMKVHPWEVVIKYHYKKDEEQYYVTTDRTYQFADFLLNRPKYYQTSHFVDFVKMIINLSSIKPDTVYYKVKYSMLLERMIDKEFYQYIMEQYETNND